MTTEDLEILKHMMNGATPPDFAVRLLEDICKRTGLDWKARHVYLQSRKNKSGAQSWQAVLSIDGFRTVGARHPAYAGQEGPFWVTSSDAAWSDIPPDQKPYAAKVGIRKRLEGTGDTTTTWGVAKYGDYYAGMMWDKFPSTMVAKCAEMLAWRKTFPETFGGLYGDAEMDQSQGTLKEDKSSMKMDGTHGTIRMNPKESLHEMEVLASIETPEPVKDPTMRDKYVEELQAAKTLSEVQAIGSRIQKDKTLEQIEVLELHQLYTKMKAKF